MFALFGAAGQALYNRADARNLEIAGSTQAKKTSWLDSKWSPVTVLTDDVYEKMLQEKLLSVNARIALIDENIEALRDQERKMKAIKEHQPVEEEKSVSSEASKSM